MLKKTLISLSVIILLLMVGLRSMSISPFALGDALDVSTSMGAKIACSGRFISGLSEQQVMQDLAAYSVATKLLSIVYTEHSVTADFIGLSTSSATYRVGLGCTIDYAQPLVDLDTLRAPPLRESSLS
ncbi:hypothetical protein RS130_02305 [Paraglaciecola aquimarina]|uniref:Lipoprotein n=1 Tax=Paraglaciecola aquimarina TaxID=1235557 RepID=A0ABU3SSF6_9ALTE|nr:hypothetical protein [Paraglaciecola aquimarina]MDU0352908.1 hypothetical protein [Paraglaciecola aquimarina]